GLCAGNVDADCGPGVCDLETNTCQGGLTPEYGETDFLTYYRLRHNTFADSLDDRTCTADWQCDGRYGDGERRGSGSRCHPAAGRCTIPMADRRSEEHTSELQSRENLVCRLLLEKKK